MKKFSKLLFAFTMGLIVLSCDDDDSGLTLDPEPQIEFTSGSADFSNYVAVGNSLTAGFSDGALFVDGQIASFPNMLAGNFELVGGGEFNIPFMADNLGGATFGGQQIFENRFILEFAASGPAPVRVDGVGTTEITNVLSGSFNNMGVPGATSFQLLAPGFGNLQGVPVFQANPYYARFASSANATVIGDAVAQDPSFFSLWIGTNDILGYAVSGGSGIDHNVTGNLDPATYGSSDITNNNVFANVYQTLVQQLTANGASGVVANIPNVTDIPFFTTVPYAPLSPANPAFGPQIPTLNATFAGLNAVFAALGVPERSIVFSETAASPVIIFDEDLPDLSQQITGALLQGGADQGTAGVLGFLYGQSRPANETDLLVLTSQTVIATLNQDAFNTLTQLGLPPASAGQLAVNGVTFPLRDRQVLTIQEQNAIGTAINSYNQTIAAIAAANGLALVDANSLLSVLNTEGFTQSDGSVVTSVFATGGGFSLDGVHPSPRGYAILANAFTEAINAQFGSNLPPVNPLDFTGLYIE